MKAYRVENQKAQHGIWRNFDGTVNPVFSQLSDGKCRNLPMADSDYYRDGGDRWFAATDTKEKLQAWFSEKDLQEMQGLGYKIYEFEVSGCRVVSDYEIVFRREDIHSQKEIQISEVFC